MAAGAGLRPELISNLSTERDVRHCGICRTPLSECPGHDDDEDDSEESE